MKAPLSWLRELVNIECSAEELAERLTFSGLEVENIARAPGITEDPEPVFDIEVTPNRPDCLSMIGIARETAALLGVKMRLPKARFPQTEMSVEDYAAVVIEDEDACPRYTILALTGIRIEPSPPWMQRRLEQCGIRPINNVVDITNYVMLECGQPLHAFDMSLVPEGKITVRRAKPGERITTLEGITHELTPDHLVIAGKRAPIALAGVMGGACSGISESTTAVLLESACFKPSIIRRASLSLGVSSDSSYRFEHGVDIGFVEKAGKRAACLIAELAGGRTAAGVIDAFPSKPEKHRITCCFSAARKLLGLKISASRIMDIFKNLDLRIIEKDRQSCVVEVPSFRQDLVNEADLVEEIARIHGLDKISPAPPKCSVVPLADDSRFRAAMVCRRCLAGLGLTEIMNYSFVSAEMLDRFTPALAERRIVLPRPVSADQAVLRDSLLPQICETLKRNSWRQTDEAALFEMGRVFYKNENGELQEEERVAVGLIGAAGGAGPDKDKEPAEEDSFLWLKGIFESLCTAMRTGHESSPAAHDGNHAFPLSFFEKDRAVLLMIDGVSAGVLGLLNNSLRNEWRLRSPVSLLEVRLEPLIHKVFKPRSVRPVPAYPSVQRDVALVVDNSVTHRSIVETILKIAPKELTKVKLFDIYYGKQLGPGRKGMAYSIEYRSLYRTLTDDEVNELHAAIKVGIRNVLQAEIREG